MSRRRMILESESEDDDELHSEKSSFCTSTPNSSPRAAGTGLEDSIMNMSVDNDRSSRRGSNSRSGRSSADSSASPSAADRSRSFLDDELDLEMSPISQRLAKSNDSSASQKLRERLLRKNHVQNKGGQDPSLIQEKSKKKSALLASSLSPIAPKPIVSSAPSSQKEASEMSDAELRAELLAQGFDCGPMIGTVWEVYEKKLQTLRDGDAKLSHEPAVRKKFNLDDKKFITPRKTSVQRMKSGDEKKDVDEASFLELSDNGDGDTPLPASQRPRTLADAIAWLEKKEAAASQTDVPLELSDVDVNSEDEEEKLEEATEPTSSNQPFIDRGYPDVSDVRKPKKDDDSQIWEEEDDKPTISTARATPALPTYTDLNRMFAHEQKKQYAGKMDSGDAHGSRMNDQTLKSFHDALSSMPDESAVVESPEGMRVELMHHQKQALAWMLWREAMNPPSGILADDMGLGKTLSMISLILWQKNERHKRREEGNDECDKKRRQIAKDCGHIPSNATLIVVPATLIDQWLCEVVRRVEPKRLSVNVFHGPKREKSAKRLASFDLVITSYSLFSNELVERVTIGEDDDDSEDYDSENYDSDDSTKNMKANVKSELKCKNNSPLAKIAWARVVLDEAHQIKNKTTSGAMAANHVPGYARWCLTGTPIHNNLWDLYSLIKFMRVIPFSDEKYWKKCILSRDARSADRLNMMMKNLLLRRTKNQVSSITQKPLIDLKPKSVHEHILELEGLERAVYDMMMEAAQVRIKKMLKKADENKQEKLDGYRRQLNKTVSSEKIINPFKSGQRMIDSQAPQLDMKICILMMLLRLRQACVHFTLTKDAMDMDSLACLGADGEMKETDLLRADVSLDESIGPDLVNEASEIFDPDYKSAKLKKIIEIIDTVIAAKEKVVIVSQWTSMLELVEAHLKRIRRLRYTAINGKVPVGERQSRVDSFNDPNGGARVMLLSLTAGGVGLNLVGGNHLVMCDLHWNPALEAQACDRIYRMGQKKDVQIHRLIAADTIEQKVAMLQESKLELAGKVLGGAASRKMNMLTMADLKFLFGLTEV